MKEKYKYIIWVLCIIILTIGSGCKESELETEPGDKSEKPTIDGGAVFNEIRNENGFFRFYRNGEKFYIKGAAFNDFIGEVGKFGGNSIRTYSVNDIDATQTLLDDAFNNDVAVMLGIWVNRPKDGFDYSNTEAVASQLNQIKEWVNLFKDHPAVMMWALGNEISSDDQIVWESVNEIGEMIKEIDSNHPITTVLPGTNQDIIREIMEVCPSIDLLGINSYEGAVSLVQNKLSDVGWEKPYMICEYGPRGTWDAQVDFTLWGETAGNGLIELTSTQKADKYRQIIKDQIFANYNKPVTCLGSFAFLWGYQTRGDVITWYPMFNRFGQAMETAHVLSYFWTSYSSSNMPPRIVSNQDIKINNKTVYDNVITTTQTINEASISASDPENDLLSYEWIVTKEGVSFTRDDDSFEGSLPSAQGVTMTGNDEKASFQVTIPGFYRLNCFVYDGNNNVAHASFPFKVEASEGDFIPQPLTLHSNLELGLQSNSATAQFIDTRTLNTYYFQSEPTGIDNAANIDFGFYRSSSTGLCIVSPLNSDAAQYIYNKGNGFGNWSPRNNTQFIQAENSVFDEDDFFSIADNLTIYDIFSGSDASSSTIKNIAVGDIIMFKTEEENYGALRINSWDDSSNGKVTFDILVRSGN